MFGRSVRTSQPQGPARIDWSNPITRGLAIVTTPFSDNAVRSIPKNAGTRGVGNAFSSTSNAAARLNTATKVTSLLEANIGTTYLAFADPKSTSGACILGGVLGGSPSEYYPQFNRSKSGGASAGTFSLSNSDATFGSDAAGVVDGNPHCFVAVLPNAAGGLISLYVDGVNRTTSSVAVRGITYPGASDYVGGYSSSGFGITGFSLYLSCWWNRALSDAEIKSISDNPWQIFASDSKSLWTPAAASVSLPTLVRPTSTISAGLWVPTGAATLHETIDEEFHVDADYMSVNAASTVELELAEAAFPGGPNQTLAYWASSTQGSTLTVTLKQGATQIMTRTHSLTGVDTLYTQTLTAPEIALITAGPISVTLTTS